MLASFRRISRIVAVCLALLVAVPTAASAQPSAVPEFAASSVAAARDSRVPDLSPEEADEAILQALADQKILLETVLEELDRWNEADQERFATWFGTSDEAARTDIRKRVEMLLDLNEEYALRNFQRADASHEDVFAYVYADDMWTIFLGRNFASAPPVGEDSRAGTLCHEMSHFDAVAGTRDHVYGSANCRGLAQRNSGKALNNADNFEYYCEGLK